MYSSNLFVFVYQDAYNRRWSPLGPLAREMSRRTDEAEREIRKRTIMPAEENVVIYLTTTNWDI
jgi:hypothetical protein